MSKALVLALPFALLVTQAGFSETTPQACAEDAMIVFDGSGSMAEMGFNDIDEPRIFDARKALADALPDIAHSRRLGLLIYGPGSEDGCSGIDLRFKPESNASAKILKAVNELQPAGETALAVAVEKAAKTLEETSGGGTVVVVTDGKETCGGQPCKLATDLAGSNLVVHVIGFKVRGSFFSWETQSDYEQADSVSRCLADRTGGYYLDTETIDELVAALKKTLGCSVLF